MIRSLAVMVVLGACAPMTAPDDPSSAMTCDAAAVQPLIGKTYSGATGELARKDSGARSIRVIHPGDAVTMDYRIDRLNIELDASDRITTLRCG